MPTLRLPSDVRSRAPSARLVYLALRDSDHALTREEIVEETGVSTDRVKRLLPKLRRAGLITSERHPHDGRRKLWLEGES